MRVSSNELFSTLKMCVTVKENALNEERVRGRDVDVRVDLRTRFVVAFAQHAVRDKDLKTRETHL